MISVLLRDVSIFDMVFFAMIAVLVLVAFIAAERNDPIAMLSLLLILRADSTTAV